MEITIKHVFEGDKSSAKDFAEAFSKSFDSKDPEQIVIRTMINDKAVQEITNLITKHNGRVTIGA